MRPLVALASLVLVTLAGCAPPTPGPDDDGGNDGDAGSTDDAGTDDAGAPDTAGRAAVLGCVATRTPAPERTDLFTDATGDVWVALGRTTDPDSFGTSGTHVWFGDALAVSSDALDVCVIDRAAITYTISHHNFQDEAAATDDGALVRVQFAIDDYDDLTPQLLLFADDVQIATLAPAP